MKPLDRLLRSWRCGQAAAHVPRGACLLDIGCGDGWFLERLARRGAISEAVGVDSDPPPKARKGTIRFLQGTMPDLQIAPQSFDAITLIAVVEHFPESKLLPSIHSCYQWLRPGGVAIMTIPSPRVDLILHWLIRLRLAEGMHVEEHHGYDVRRTVPLFESAQFQLRHHHTFQFGLNHLFVFDKPA